MVFISLKGKIPTAEWAAWKVQWKAKRKRCIWAQMSIRSWKTPQGRALQAESPPFIFWSAHLTQMGHPCCKGKEVQKYIFWARDNNFLGSLFHSSVLNKQNCSLLANILYFCWSCVKLNLDYVGEIMLKWFCFCLVAVMNINMLNRTGCENVDLSGCEKSNIMWISLVFNLQTEWHLFREGKKTAVLILMRNSAY